MKSKIPWSDFSTPLLGRLTGSGQAVLVGCVAGMYALWGLPLVWIFTGFLCLILVSLAFNYWSTPRLNAVSKSVRWIHRGEQVEIRIQVENPSKRAARHLELVWKKLPKEWTLLSPVIGLGNLMPHASKTVSCFFTVGKRGEYEWPSFEIVGTFPFGLTRQRQRFVVEDRLTVAPARMGYLPSIYRQTVHRYVQGHQLHLTSLGLDYAGSREYVPGSPPGRWDYASWSRIGKPVVKEYSDQERTTHLNLILDPCVSSHQQRDRDVFESVLEVAASLIHWLNRHGTDVAVWIPGESALERPLMEEASIMIGLALAQPIIAKPNETIEWRFQSRSWRADPTLVILGTTEPWRRSWMMSLGLPAASQFLIASVTSKTSQSDQAPAVLIEEGATA